MMNQVLHPLASEHPFSSEQECIDHIGAHAHHSPFAAGVPDPLRREGALGHSAASIPHYSNPSRYSAHRPDAAYQSGAGLSDTGSGSITASPSSSASSSLAFSFPPTAATSLYSNHLPLANFPYGYSAMSQNRRTSMMTDSSSSAMLPPTRSPGMGNPVSPALGASTRDNYTTSTPGLHRRPHTLSPRHPELPRYSSLPETPRSVLPTTMPLSTTYPASSMGGYAAQPDRLSETPPFNAQDNFGEITCEGNTVVPNIEAKIEKGFFWSGDRVWTCYRRNYFAVNVSYGLSPWLPGARLYLNQGNGKGPDQIQSLAVSLAAAVDGTGGKNIELIQHTPKRDKGPQLAMKKELLAPTPPGKTQEQNYGLNSFHQSTQVAGPSLPLQTEAESSQQYSPATHPNSNYQHSFERIQFKSATANNGKRRAQQQYYHLIVELWANVQNPRDADPRWVKIAAKSSHPVVVRGRSPSHYQNEGPHNQNASRGTGSGGMGGSGHRGLGSNGGTSYSGGYRNGLSGSGTSTMGGGMYRGTTYSLDPSPVGSHSVSSASSLSAGPVEGLVGGDQHMVDDDDAKMIDTHTDYQYYPAPIYETIPAKVESVGLPLPLPDRRIKEEYPGPASMSTGWPVGGCGRFQGMETSRGYYPDVHAHTGY